MRLGIVAACVGLCVAGIAGPHSASAQQRKRGDTIVGASWQFEVKETAKRDAKPIASGRFIAHPDGKLYTPKRVEIGSYKYTNAAETELTMEVKEGKLKGTIELVKQGRTAPSWQGKIKMEDGTTGHITVKMVKD